MSSVAGQTLPVTAILTAYTGSCLLHQFRWLPDGDTPADFTAWAARLLIGPAKGTAAIQYHTVGVSDTTTPNTPDELNGYPYCPSENAGIYLLADGIIVLHLPDTVTTALPTVALTYVVDLIDADGMVFRFLRGPFRVVRDTRARTT